ncbi:hypothetical protein WH50_23550 [Pokkaliibacter plantistimulans]|uniref:DUF1365 domain-containing protein n=1 Tax=Pokkaliibacter plantistimulans TaxID=1635171 RepID=A0ABX5LRT4_9GAMM|nr:DUF1365 domain-containing protein [Pokkaliibacter plantistimulans]PXF28922.1 hypothetical protein WH50_23550 [Pokkaliibacter plantistimulans]
MMNSCLYPGTVMHHRFKPRVHRFVYRVTAWLFDLDELPVLDQQLTGFSYNAPNLFSLCDADHGLEPGQSLRDFADEINARHGLPRPARVELLCYPRILGYAFNPLAIYFCYNTAGQLQATLHQVSNTFGQRHLYVIPAEPSRQQGVRYQQADKVFYVSPFIDMDCRYRFRILPPAERVSVAIRQTDPEGVLLHAVFSAERQPLSQRGLWRQFLAMPLMTVKVMAAIHWEALRLWLKGVRLVPRPPQRAARITLGRMLDASATLTPAISSGLKKELP